MPTILGKSFQDLEEIEAVHGGWVDVPASASAGAETALWDLVGQQAQVPLAEMLGASAMRIGAGVESGLVLDLLPTVTDLMRAAESHLEEGYRRLTISIAPGRDLEFVEAIRRSHPDLPLAIDAGQRFSRSDLSLFRQIDEMMPLWISEPLPREDLEGLKALQDELMNPISLDAGDEEAIRSGACRVARLAIQTAGGFGAVRKRHDFCAKNGVDCWVGTAPSWAWASRKRSIWRPCPTARTRPTPRLRSAGWWTTWSCRRSSSTNPVDSWCRVGQVWGTCWTH